LWGLLAGWGLSSLAALSSFSTFARLMMKISRSNMLLAANRQRETKQYCILDVVWKRKTMHLTLAVFYNNNNIDNDLKTAVLFSYELLNSR